MSNLIKSWNDRAIRIRSDRYVSLTDMAQASGKLFGHWNNLKSTKSYLKALKSVIQIGITDLVQVIQSRDRLATRIKKSLWRIITSYNQGDHQLSDLGIS